jgi:CDP-glucose 4,6-dehydratase
MRGAASIAGWDNRALRDAWGMTATTFWRERRVLVTGHMGFKGAWLTAVLDRLGAYTLGYGTDDRDPLLYRNLALDHHTSIDADILDTERLAAAIADRGIDIVFHLAAQPNVRESYLKPLETFSANILGTASVLEAARSAASVEVVVCATSDKVYENQEWDWAYRETDSLGGRDPYSASKAAAEIVARSMASSFFGPAGHRARVVTVRSGNVIGGGDWCKDRIIPDAARAFSKGDTLMVRNPHSTRPWQHVLDPLWGYMELARFLHAADHAPHPAWNFGPDPVFSPVSEVVERFAAVWGNGCHWAVEQGAGPKLHEAGRLSVDSTRARRELGWRPLWNLGETVNRSAHWYRDFCGDPSRAGELVRRDIDDYFEAMTLAAVPHGSTQSAARMLRQEDGKWKDRNR